MSENSGPIWCSRFPTSRSLDTLDSGWRPNVEAFIGSMQDGGATVAIQATRRPVERAYLMHSAWLIAKMGVSAGLIKPWPGVDIIWNHDAGVEAALQMVVGFGMAHQAVMDSLHIEGLAIDMDISWTGDRLNMRDVHGSGVTITGEANGQNQRLWSIGAGFGVIKLPSDRPHWSRNGH